MKSLSQIFSKKIEIKNEPIEKEPIVKKLDEPKFRSLSEVSLPKTGPFSIGAMETRSSSPSTQSIKEAIGSVETEEFNNDLNKAYSFSRPAGSGTSGNTAIGRYQVTTDELNSYARKYLGKNVTADEFRNSKELQEKYMDNKITDWQAQGIDLDNIIVNHRGGLKATVQQYQPYVDKVKSKLGTDTSVSSTLTSASVPDSVKSGSEDFDVAKSDNKAGLILNILNKVGFIKDERMENFSKYGFFEGLVENIKGIPQEISDSSDKFQKLGILFSRVSSGQATQEEINEYNILAREQEQFAVNIVAGMSSNLTNLAKKIVNTKTVNGAKSLLKELGIKLEAGADDLYKRIIKTNTMDDAGKLLRELTSSNETKIVEEGSELLQKGLQKAEAKEVELLKKLQDPKAPSSFSNDIANINKSQIDDLGLNLETMNLSNEGKAVMESELEKLKTIIAKKTGSVLTNQEIIELADKSSKILNEVVGREQTLKWSASVLKLDQKITAMANEGRVTSEFRDAYVAAKTIKTDIARKLQSLSITAEGKEVTAMQSLLDSISKVVDDMEPVLKAAQEQGIDFNNFKQASEFYRQFVAPRASEWLDALRYNSMLSSPLTHVKNIFSNLLNATARPVLTKMITGFVDMLKTTFTGRERQYFAGEGVEYAKHYLKNFRGAVQRFTDVWKWKRAITNLDLRKQVPLATKGTKSAIEKALKVTMTLLEAADQFFMALSEGGETAALKYRMSKGGIVSDLTAEAQNQAKYGLFRQELFPDGQGVVLNAIDSMTALIETARNSKNPIVSTIAKYTLPFVRTPMNIFKQGLEYSPLGFTTAIGSKNATEQISKAIMGSGIGILAGTLLASNRMTWAEPERADEKNAYREMGMQPYSIKIGNKWYSYQYLPPFLSFPLAMVAAVHDTIKNGKLDDDAGDTILSAVAKYADFMSDQSYFKSLGDLWAMIGGDEFAWSRVIGNYWQQLVPLRALGGWLARITDEYQRTIDGKAGFLEKQVQLLMMNIPELSKTLPARKGAKGRPLLNVNKEFNSISPIRILPQTDTQERQWEAKERKKNKSKVKTFKSLKGVL